jgi:hypothetical protein
MLHNSLHIDSEGPAGVESRISHFDHITAVQSWHFSPRAIIGSEMGMLLHSNTWKPELTGETDFSWTKHASW